MHDKVACVKTVQLITCLISSYVEISNFLVLATSFIGIKNTFNYKVLSLISKHMYVGSIWILMTYHVCSFIHAGVCRGGFPGVSGNPLWIYQVLRKLFNK